MKNKLQKFLIVLITIFSLVNFASNEKVKANTTAIQDPPRTLLVYDSLDEQNNGQSVVETLERLLMSMGQQLTVISMQNYHKGMLLNGNYQNVVTMINWPEMNFDNPDFDHDRQRFKGRKLHIGRNLTSSEKESFSGNWVDLNQQTFVLKGDHDYYKEQLGFQREIELLQNPTNGTTPYATLISKSGDNKQYPYALFSGNNAYIPYFNGKGATLLASLQVIARWLGVKGNYNPYITVMNFTPLSSFSVTEKFIQKLNEIENNVIITTTSTLNNTCSRTFHNYIKFIKQMTKDNHGIIYLNVPSLNSADKGNNDTLGDIITQEISIFVENAIFPLGISAPVYWNFDKYYQLNALNFGNGMLFYNQEKDVYYHTKTQTSHAYPTTFFAIKHQDLYNVRWHINGKYTEYTFPVPTALTYSFPESDKQVTKMFTEITNDHFPPTDQYLGKFNTGIFTQTQNIQGKDGIITLNGVTVNNINFEAIQNQIGREHKAVLNPAQRRFQMQKGFMGKINDILIIIIGITLVVLIILLSMGRKLYLKMFRKQSQKKGK